MAGLIVAKFGGSSVSTSKTIGNLELILKDPEKGADWKVIVVSAPGKRHETDEKVTDLLIELSHDNSNEVLYNKIIGRYKELLGSENISGVADLLRDRVNRTNLPKEEYTDLLKAFGEEACARILARRLGLEYVDPRDLMILSKDFGNGSILPQSEQLIHHRLLSGLSEGKRFIIPGFFGYSDDEGKIVTLSRGGSDLTAAYLAFALDATLYENWTDINGIAAADPRLVNNPRRIKEMTFREIRDLAYSGFNILHHEAMRPVENKGIPIHVRNTFEPSHEGTYIVTDRISDPMFPVVGVAYKSGFCSFDVDRIGWNEQIDLLLKAGRVFKEHQIPIAYIPTGIDDFSFIVRGEKLASLGKVGDVIKSLYCAFGQGTEIKFQDNLSCVVVAGKGLKGYRGIAAQIQQCLADANINIKFISQGPEERCIIYGINSVDGKVAVNAIYGRFIERKLGLI